MSEETHWLDDYFDQYKKLAFEESIYSTLIDFKSLSEVVRDKGKKLILAGNGASASISAHGSVDFTKQARVRSINFNEGNLITCFANDYGYEHWVSKAIEHYADDGDVVVLTSCSGSSPNVVNAAKYAKSVGLKVVTFTGFGEDNPLKALGDINFWVDSKAYNIVEGIHMMWLTTVIDMVIGKAIYSTAVKVH